MGIPIVILFVCLLHHLGMEQPFLWIMISVHGMICYSIENDNSIASNTFSFISSLFTFSLYPMTFPFQFLTFFFLFTFSDHYLYTFVLYFLSPMFHSTFALHSYSLLFPVFSPTSLCYFLISLISIFLPSLSTFLISTCFLFYKLSLVSPYSWWLHFIIQLLFIVGSTKV